MYCLLSFGKIVSVNEFDEIFLLQKFTHCHLELIIQNLYVIIKMSYVMYYLNLVSRLDCFLLK